MTSSPISLFVLILEYAHSFLAMGLLLLLSAFVSGCETALFSLTHFDRVRLREISHRTAAIVEKLIKKPEQLLLALMVANMAVNSLLFAISSILVYHFAHAGHPVFASTIGIGTLLILVLFGEILSKAWVYYLRIPAATLLAWPVWILMQSLQPLLVVVERFFLVPMVRLIVGINREPEVSRDELVTLFNISGREGYLQPAQVDLLTRLVGLTDQTVDTIMVPRVQMTSCEIHEPVEKVRDLVRRTHQPVLAVYVYEIDYIVGIIRSRRLFVEQPQHLREILEPVKFVPDLQRVDQLLHYFHTQDIDFAMVVNEYGGLVGMVSMDELLESAIGKLQAEIPEPDAPQMIQLIAGEYLADGHLPLEEFCRKLDLPRPEADVDTLGGLVMILAGHLPAIGERLEYHGVRLIVREIDYNRLKKILVLDKDTIHAAE